MDSKKAYMLRTGLGMLNTNLLRKQLMCIPIVFKGILDMDPFASLEEVTQGLSKSLHYASINAFLHIIVSNAPICDIATQNSW